MPVLASFGAASAKTFGLTRKKGATAGQISYTSAGNYTFTVPTGATKLSIMAVNGGGRGGSGGARGIRYICPCTGCWVVDSIGFSGSGGGGGNFKWKNCITVSAGKTVYVRVGNNTTSYRCGASTPCCSKSYVTICCVTYAGESGNDGFNYGGSGSGGNTVGYCCSAAGGYGGGAAGWGSAGGSPGYGSTYGGAGGCPGAGGATGGGGVGILNRGSGGTGFGLGGSGGTNGTGGTGGTYGGGGVGGSYSGNGLGNIGLNGGVGAVRILWTYTGGPVRQYPTTNTGDL